jgi:hypothetical protein
MSQATSERCYQLCAAWLLLAGETYLCSPLPCVAFQPSGGLERRWWDAGRPSRCIRATFAPYVPAPSRVSTPSTVHRAHRLFTSSISHAVVHRAIAPDASLRVPIVGVSQELVRGTLHTHRALHAATVVYERLDVDWLAITERSPTCCAHPTLMPSLVEPLPLFFGLQPACLTVHLVSPVPSAA